MCLAAKLDYGHECRDAFGHPHDPRDVGKLTLDHVKDHAMMGKRAPSDAKHLVAVCFAANVYGWCSAHRQLERDYLAWIER